MQVIPTLLTTTTAEFTEQMDIFQRNYSRIQLDIADGDLVPNHTVQIDEMIQLIKKNRVPLFPSVEFDFHLMVRDFTKELNKIKKLQKLGVQVNTVLVNAALHPNIPALTNEYQFSIGLDTFPDITQAQLARQYDLKMIPTIQIMTVNPGFQGSPFLEEMLLKLEQLRRDNYKGTIMIDGGVNEVTIPLIQSKKYRPDFLCIGSYLTKAGDEFASRVKALKNV